jgi:hypothetical protein
LGYIHATQNEIRTRGRSAPDRQAGLSGSPMLHSLGNVCSALQGSAPRRSYVEAYRDFLTLADLADLDSRVSAEPLLTRDFEHALETALADAYAHTRGEAQEAHLFLQRVLYRINRLKLFWFDDLQAYDNERSNYLRAVRDRIEAPWQRWELASLDVETFKREEVAPALRARAAADVDPPVSANGRFFREEVREPGYRRLLEIASLDGLVEASQLSRTLGGVSNDVHAMVTRLFLEEYGCGRLERKHSSYFAVMLSELGMSTVPEHYFDRVPWEVLAAINHSFLLSERKRHYLRYIGGLLYTEISVPAAFTAYHVAAQRLGFSEAAMAYWDLHIREDERHGRWMLNDIALPLAARYPQHAWELILGYEQQRALGDRAGASVAAAAREADRASASQVAQGALA